VEAEQENAWALCRAIYEAAKSECTTVTWLNHYTAKQSLALPELEEVQYVGIDGLLLRSLIGGSIPRTSADVLLPVLLANSDIASVVLLGGVPGRAADKVPAVRSLCRSGEVDIRAYDGYGDLSRLRAGAWDEHVLSADLVVLGLGSPMQDAIAVELGRVRQNGLVITCGGWLDQVGTSYYPSWAYGLKVNWLIRLAHEPKRLLPRYTKDALSAVAQRRALRGKLLQLPGLNRYVNVFKDHH
jgi:UDP-N-acetyl-D-mannosaminuronic acid transferase (WecB/TagA/CpsF family)